MKKTILTLTVTGVMVAASLNTYGQENRQAEKARKDVAESQQDLREAKIDSAADYQKFKKDAEIKINDNQKRIVELKRRKANDNKEVNDKYNKDVLAIEKKNNELNKRIEGSGNTKSNMWNSFKNEFNHDMNELGLAFKDIGVDNKN